MKKTNIKKSSGITLIALIITIIVLLILAGITIATIVEDDGVINKAQSAKTKTQYADKKEKVELAYAEATINENNELDEDAFIEGVHKALGNDAIVTPNEDGSYTVEHKGDIITISANGKAEQGGEGSGNNSEKPGDDTSLMTCKECNGKKEVSGYYCHGGCGKVIKSDDPNLVKICAECSDTIMDFETEICVNCNGEGSLLKCNTCDGTGLSENPTYFCYYCDDYVDEVNLVYVIYCDDSEHCPIYGHDGDVLYTTEQEAIKSIENCYNCYYTEAYACNECEVVDEYETITACRFCNGRGGALIGETIDCEICNGTGTANGYKCNDCGETKIANQPSDETVYCYSCSYFDSDSSVYTVEMEYGTYDCNNCDGDGVLYECIKCKGTGMSELYYCYGCYREVEELFARYRIVPSEYSSFSDSGDSGSGGTYCYYDGHDGYTLYTKEEAETELNNTDCSCEMKVMYNCDECYMYESYNYTSEKTHAKCSLCDGKGGLN